MHGKEEDQHDARCFNNISGPSDDLLVQALERFLSQWLSSCKNPDSTGHKGLVAGPLRPGWQERQSLSFLIHLLSGLFL